MIGQGKEWVVVSIMANSKRENSDNDTVGNYILIGPLQQVLYNNLPFVFDIFNSQILPNQ